MTTLTMTSRPLAGLLTSALAAVVAFFAAARTAHRASADFAALNGLSERQLNDIGLTRADLPRMLFDRHFH